MTPILEDPHLAQDEALAALTTARVAPFSEAAARAAETPAVSSTLSPIAVLAVAAVPPGGRRHRLWWRGRPRNRRNRRRRHERPCVPGRPAARPAMAVPRGLESLRRDRRMPRRRLHLRSRSTRELRRRLCEERQRFGGSLRARHHQVFNHRLQQAHLFRRRAQQLGGRLQRGLWLYLRAHGRRAVREPLHRLAGRVRTMRVMASC